MPALHQIEQALLREITHAAPELYHKNFLGWIEYKPPCFRHRVDAWYVMSDLLADISLPLAGLMRTMPTIMPMLARWTNQQRYLRRHHPNVLLLGGSYPATPQTEAFTNRMRGCIEKFDILVSRPERLFAYVRLRSEVQSHGYRTREQRARGISNQVGTIGTWNTMPLGKCFTGRAYFDNMNGGRLPLTVKAINGCEYHGTYYFTAGDYCRLKMVKADLNRVRMSDWSFETELSGGEPVKFPPTGE